LANHKSALKRIRQSEKRRVRNKHVRTGMRSEIKRFNLAIEAGDASLAGEHLPKVESAIRRAASKGLIRRQHADRRVSRLTRSLNSLNA
jgi:small subunit ribosomal protein S20